LPIVLIMSGLPGVGKTTIARQLAPLINGVVLSTDKIRKELFYKPSYGRRERKLIYDILTLLAKYLCASNVNCILDATFSQKRSRQEIRNKLNPYSKKIIIIECICPEDIVIARLDRRKHDFSDANFSVYRNMKRIYEPVEEEHVTFDTSKISITDIERIAKNILNRN
jgi:predicted kinase